MVPPARDSGHIRCICGDDDDDGFTIQCERCLVWQHAKCVGVGRSSVPERYFCERCGPIDISSFVGITGSTGTSGITGISGNASTANATNGTNFTSSLTTLTTSTSVIPTPPGVPFCNEIAENIVSLEAKETIQSQLKSINFPALLRRQGLLQCTSPANFEFTPLPCFDSPVPPANRPGLEVKEIRSRGYQKKGTSTRYGLFTHRPCDPGHFIAEFVGHLQPRDSIVIKKEKNANLPLQVTQSFVLFLPNSLAIDARKFGSPVRYVRRSCRPNVQVKQFICADGRVGWGLFAKNIICAGAELLLPLDYALMGGKALFRYDCACNTPEFCLGPPGEVSSVVTGSSTGLARSSSPLLMDEASGIVGVRRSSSVVQISSTALVNSEEPLLPQRPVLDTRKLSREERKLQQYIEYFERMDSVAETTKQRSTSSIGGSRSRASTSPKSGAASTGKTASPKSKKSWKTLFEDGEVEEDHVVDTVAGAVTGSVEENVDISFDESTNTTTATTTNTTTAAAVPITKGKRGRKPGSKNKPKVDENASLEDSAMDDDVKPSSPVKRKKSPELAIVDEDLDIGGEAQEVSKPKKLKTKVEDHLNTTTTATTTTTTATTKTTTPTNANTTGTTVSLNLSPVHHQQQQSSSSIQPQPPQPDTPTKKKLSLSDYLKKRKASPQESTLNDFPSNEQAVFGDSSLLSDPVIPTIERSKSVQELREAIFGESSMNAVNEATSGRSSVISSVTTTSSQERDREREREYDRGGEKVDSYARSFDREREFDRGIDTSYERGFDRVDRHERNPYEHEHSSQERNLHSEHREHSPFERRSIDYSYERQPRRSVEYSSYDRSVNVNANSNSNVNGTGNVNVNGNGTGTGNVNDYSSHDRDYSSHHSSHASHSSYTAHDRDRDYSSYDRSNYERSFNDHRPYSRPPSRPPFARYQQQTQLQRDSRDYQPRPAGSHSYNPNRHNYHQGRPPFRPHRGGHAGSSNPNGHSHAPGTGNSAYRPPKRDYRPPYNNDYSR